MKNIADFEENGQPGDWVYLEHDGQKYMLINLESNGDRLVDQVIASCPYSEDGSNGTWKISGDKDHPTLEPSIKVTGGPDNEEQWHGWLRDGKLISIIGF